MTFLSSYSISVAEKLFILVVNHRIRLMRVIGLLGIVAYLHTTVAFSQNLAGTLKLKHSAQPGYTLFTSLNTKNTYLIDRCGNVINSWHSDYASGSSSYLLEDGNLLRAANVPNPVIDRAGGGGRLEIMDWDSNIIWTFDYNTPLVRQHHDILPMPNGNVLILAWQFHSGDEARSVGRNPDALLDDMVWAEEIVEVKPIFPDNFEIVWRWSAWDHLIQDFDATKPNFGVVSDHPELINLNFVQGNGNRDWIHGNALDYNADLDQVMICTPFFNEFWIIDHSTSTAEAATHAGGNSDKGGDLLYRWGNPRAYKQGTVDDQTLFGQHHAHWIKKGLPQEGNIMVFNNNAGPNFSSVDIINPPMSLTGEYLKENGRFGPLTSMMSIRAHRPEWLFSSIMSGAEMLPNGNVLICPSLQGRFVELTPSLDTAWLYKSPITANGIAGIDFTPENSAFRSDPSFRAIKYTLDYPGFAGKDLTPGPPIEGGIGCEYITGTNAEDETSLRLYPNPVSEFLYVESPDPSFELDVSLFDFQGHELAHASGCGKVSIYTECFADGLLIASVNGKSEKILKMARLK